MEMAKRHLRSLNIEVMEKDKDEQDERRTAHRMLEYENGKKLPEGNDPISRKERLLYALHVLRTEPADSSHVYALTIAIENCANEVSLFSELM